MNNFSGIMCALALSTLAACQTSSGSSEVTTVAPVAAATGNQTAVGPISYGGSYVVAPNGTAIIHGGRKGCTTAPSFESVGVAVAPTQGTLYDAGISSRNSDSCGRSVPTRAIGYQASPTLTGMDKIVFNGGAEVTITSP